MRELPQYQYVYLGDTARTPYGSRPKETVLKFTKQAIDFLFQEGCELVIVACNTASAEALREIQQTYLPHKYPKGKRVLGVIIPTVELVAGMNDARAVGVLGTTATVRSGAFVKELKKRSPHVKVFQLAAPLLVPLIEAGEHHSKPAEDILRAYLKPLVKKKIDTLILGCTHYGHLVREVKNIVGRNMRVISEGPVVAKKLKEYLKRHPEIDQKLSKKRRVHFYTTDESNTFQKLGKLFYGKIIVARIARLDGV